MSNHAALLQRNTDVRVLGTSGFVPSVNRAPCRRVNREQLSTALMLSNLSTWAYAVFAGGAVL